MTRGFRKESSLEKKRKKSLHFEDDQRLVVLSLFLCVLFCALVIRFYQIQILEGEKWTKIALQQHRCVIVEPAKRGSFYSNTSIKPGHPEVSQAFVVDILKFHLCIDPDAIRETVKEKMAKELMAHFFLTKEQEEKFSLEFQKKSRSRRLMQWMDRDQRKAIEEWWFPFAIREKLPKNALFFVSDYQRSYPFGSMLGTVLHTLQKEKDPLTQQAIPTGGLELVFNQYLQGKPGKREMLKSPRRPLDMGKVIELAENGADIYLTINHYLQAIAEKELEKGVNVAKARGGWAVMMDPMTGEILALAQTPSFDPAHYSDYFNEPSLLESTRVKAINDCFEPGSIFKPVALAICMKANEELMKLGKPPLFTPEEKVSTLNGHFPGRSVPLKDGRSHAYLNMFQALQRSSNIYPARMVHRVIETFGDAWYRKTLVDLFSLGQKMNLELPGENPGMVPTPGKLHPNGKLEWSMPTPYSLAIGYNVLVNSIQIAKIYSIFANGGFDVSPHIVRKIVKQMPDGSQKVIQDNTEIYATRRVLSSSIVDAIVKGLKFVTKEGGNSKLADVMGYTEAGKSGTAEKIIDGIYSKNNHISSFVGFVPVKKPRFVLIVSIDDPEKKIIPGIGKQQLGGVCAAPVFREIAMRALQYLGVEPDDPYGYPSGDPRRDATKADWVREVQDLKALYEQWNAR